MDDQGHPSSSVYVTATLTPSAGLISTVDDVAQYVLALTSGVLLQPQTKDNGNDLFVPPS